MDDIANGRLVRSLGQVATRVVRVNKHNVGQYSQHERGSHLEFVEKGDQGGP